MEGQTLDRRVDLLLVFRARACYCQEMRKKRLKELFAEIEKMLEKLGGGKSDLLVLKLEDLFQEIRKLIGD